MLMFTREPVSGFPDISFPNNISVWAGLEQIATAIVVDLLAEFNAEYLNGKLEIPPPAKFIVCVAKNVIVPREALAGDTLYSDGNQALKESL